MCLFCTHVHVRVRFMRRGINSNGYVANEVSPPLSASLATTLNPTQIDEMMSHTYLSYFSASHVVHTSCSILTYLSISLFIHAIHSCTLGGDGASGVLGSARPVRLCAHAPWLRAHVSTLSFFHWRALLCVCVTCVCMSLIAGPRACISPPCLCVHRSIGSMPTSRSLCVRFLGSHSSVVYEYL